MRKVELRRPLIMGSMLVKPVGLVAVNVKSARSKIA